MKLLPHTSKVRTECGPFPETELSLRTRTGHLDTVKDLMDSCQYQQILENIVQESVIKLELQRGFYLCKRGATKYCCHVSAGVSVFMHRPTFEYSLLTFCKSYKLYFTSQISHCPSAM